MYTAIDITVQREDAQTTYSISLGGGDMTPEKQRQVDELNAYIKGQIHNIERIQKVQMFLLCAGYGLSNVIVTSASSPYQTDGGAQIITESYNEKVDSIVAWAHANYNDSYGAQCIVETMSSQQINGFDSLAEAQSFAALWHEQYLNTEAHLHRGE